MISMNIRYLIVEGNKARSDNCYFIPFLVYISIHLLLNVIWSWKLVPYSRTIKSKKLICLELPYISNTHISEVAVC